MYTIRFAAGVASDLRACSAYHRRIIFSAIETHLSHTPTVPSRRRKVLPNLTPLWETVLPIWELRVGEYRVFYDVVEVDQVVTVRTIRHKPPSQRTEDIL